MNRLSNKDDDKFYNNTKLYTQKASNYQRSLIIYQSNNYSNYHNNYYSNYHSDVHNLNNIMNINNDKYSNTNTNSSNHGQDVSSFFHGEGSVSSNCRDGH